MLQILETLRKNQMTAMKNKDQYGKVVANLLLARISNADKDTQFKQKRELTDAEVIDQIKSELKQTRDALTEAVKGNRVDQVTENEEKIKVILTYLPKQLDETEITEVIKTIAKELGLDLVSKSKGQIMKAVMAKCGENVEGKTVNIILGKLLV